MNIIRKPFIMLIIFFTSAAAQAGWDQNCVDTCISTHHACNYCDYQCWQEDVAKPEYETGDNYRCPLQGYN